MVEVDVHPESIHLAAVKVDDAGQDWGGSADELTDRMDSAADAYGADMLGTALDEMYRTAGPTALTYLTETGFCVVETAIALDQLADAYTLAEADNTAQTERVNEIIDSLGDP